MSKYTHRKCDIETLSGLQSKIPSGVGGWEGRGSGRYIKFPELGSKL